MYLFVGRMNGEIMETQSNCWSNVQQELKANRMQLESLGMAKKEGEGRQAQRYQRDDGW